MYERASPVYAPARDSAATPAARRDTPAPAAPAHPILTLQRSIGNRAVGRLLKSRALQAKLRIHPPGDAYEREADRVSDSVVHGGGGFASALPSTRSIQRDDTPPGPSTPPAEPGRLPADAGVLPSGAPPSTADKLKQAAQKTSDALRKTKAGKQLEVQAAQLGKDFLATTEGKVIAATAVTGALAGLIATDSSLPVQLPEIPLDWVMPGLKGKLTYEGKVREPSKVFLTLTFTPGAAKKPAQSDSDKFRAETNRMAADAEKFRQGTKTTPGSRQDEDAKAEREALEHWAAARLGVEKALPQTWTPHVDNLAHDAWKEVWDNYFKLRRQELTAPPASESTEGTPTTAGPVMRKETEAGSPAVPQAVEDVLRSPAAELDPNTRSSMESSFGRDLSGVRVHTGAAAAESAASIDARAYTVGRDIVFGASQYAPGTSVGTRLLAHELTHVVQQSAASAEPQTPDTGAPASSSRFAQPPGTPLEKEADSAADRAAAGGKVGPVSAAGVGSVQRQEKPKDKLPPAAAVTASLRHLTFTPVERDAKFHAGSGESQLVAMAIRALLDTGY
ncbi:MAG: DUF4157 domain-containing protein, partial [Bryobacteraceae bacterium]